MEGNRILPESRPKPVVTLDKDLFPFVHGYKIGQKDQLIISGVISRERKFDEDIFKHIRILRADPVNNNEARIQ